MKLSIFYPVKPLFVNQKFGEVANLAYYEANGINFKGHNGIDFAAKHGQPVYASHDGLCYPEIDPGGGNGVVITTLQPFDYGTSTAYFKTIFWHLIQDDAVVKTGQQVKVGELIGYADSTGLSTGDHLHFGLKPMSKGEPAGTWYNLEQDNGYMGAIDPMPYFNGLFAQDINQAHLFTQNITIGDSGPEVLSLQNALQKLGFFKVTPTGYYGPITKAAVYAFQLKYVAIDTISKLQVWFNRGDAVRTLTRSALNALL